jgi:hypothetical protein
MMSLSNSVYAAMQNLYTPGAVVTVFDDWTNYRFGAVRLNNTTHNVTNYSATDVHGMVPPNPANASPPPSFRLSWSEDDQLRAEEAFVRNSNLTAAQQAELIEGLRISRASEWQNYERAAIQGDGSDWEWAKQLESIEEARNKLKTHLKNLRNRVTYAMNLLHRGLPIPQEIFTKIRTHISNSRASVNQHNYHLSVGIGRFHRLHRRFGNQDN